MFWTDAKVILHLLRGQPKVGTHRQRLQAFYAPQAENYDVFRERLLFGRDELIDLLAPAEGAHVVELGGGTGRNLLYFGERLQTFYRVELVDLCPALLEKACRRQFSNVHFIEADATVYQPKQPVDCVYFSYSLTMIPDWQGAIDNALKMLKPNGTLGVVDFYVSAPKVNPGEVLHGPFTRLFWPRWFAHDGVHPNPEHLAYLRTRVSEYVCHERRAPVPYLPGLRVPYYIFVGRNKKLF